jgi:hypothetical protein
LGAATDVKPLYVLLVCYTVLTHLLLLLLLLLCHSQIMLDLVSSNLQHCESELARIKAEQPRRIPTQQRMVDVTLLVLTGAWFYRAWELGGGSSSGSLSGVWGLLDGAGGVLPAGYDGLEKALVLMLLLAAVSRMVRVRLA